MKNWGKLFIAAAVAAFLLFPIKSTVNAQEGQPTAFSNLGFWECYGDGSMDPCHNNLNAVEYLAVDNAWAVGDGGRIIHWNGTSWQIFSSPTTDSLRGIKMITLTEGWAVGGDILYWNGTAWSVNNSLGWDSLNAISMLNANNGWAVGNYGTVYHWDGATWSKVDFPNKDISLDGVDVISANDVWVVSSYMAIYHWNGAVWEEVQQPVTTYSQFLDIDMVSSNDGWIVGTYYRLFRWNGTQWINYQQMYPSNGGIWDISMNSSTDGWAVGDFGAKFHWNGTNWEPIGGLSSGDPGYRSVSIIGNNGWVVGNGGAILQYSLGTWVEINTPDGNALTDLGFSSIDDGWAVGGGGKIKHWDGFVWQTVTSPSSEYLRSIAVVSPNNAWAVGGKQLLHWDGISWSIVVNTPDHYFDLVVADGSDVWVAGSDYVCDQACTDVNTNISHWNGVQWATSVIPHRSIGTLVYINKDFIWAGGDNFWNGPAYPTILRWNGTTWIEFSDFTLTIADIAASNEQNAWTAGWRTSDFFPILLKWDGVSWKEQAITPPADIGILEIAPNGDVWATTGGDFLKLSGDIWNVVGNPASWGVYGFQMLSIDKGWAVGRDGVILEYRLPKLTTNYGNGSPGSYFNIIGSDFPPNQTAAISINGHSLGTVPVGSDGSFVFTLSTAAASEGIYYLTVSVNPTVTLKFTLDSSDPVRQQVGSYGIVSVPPGIGFSYEVFLPLVKR